MTKTVTIKLYAVLGGYLPAGAEKNQAHIEANDDATIVSVLADLSVPEEHCHLVLVNGAYVPPSARSEYVLEEGDALAVWPPVAGG